MSNPFRSLKFLPWQALFVVAFAAIAIATVFDVLLLVAARSVPMLEQAIALLLSPGVNIFVLFGVSALLGAMAVWLLEFMYPLVAITVGVLWALLGCLVVVQFLVGFFPVPQGLMAVNEFSTVGLLIGVFLLRGKRYWR